MLNPYIEAWELRELVLNKEIRPREVAEFFLARTQKLNPRLGAFMTITAERAIADAERIEKLSNGERRRCLMFGVPYSIKDLNWTADIITTMGSRSYANYRAPADEEIVVRMRNAGGILLGKTTTPEFGARPTTEGGLCPPARNPWNLEHTAGDRAVVQAAPLQQVSDVWRRAAMVADRFEFPPRVAAWLAASLRAVGSRSHPPWARRGLASQLGPNGPFGARCRSVSRCARGPRSRRSLWGARSGYLFSSRRR